MTDLRDLLDTVAGEPGMPTPDLVAADARRGRRALVRRRSARGAMGVVAAATLALGVTVLPGVVGGDPQNVSVAAKPGPEAVLLVPFDAGPTPKPVSPAQVPEGWTVSGGESALVISRPGVTTSPDDWEGKLVAQVDRDSTPGADAGEIAVGARRGTVSHDHGTAILLFHLADGRQVLVQAPPALHWDDATVAQFAAGLTISKDATAGVG